MMGRQRLEELKQNGRQLVADGHREGHELLELTDELDRLRAREWTPERLCDAIDTVVALYVSEQGLGRNKGLSNTSVLELIEWMGSSLRPAGADRSRLDALESKLHEVLEVFAVVSPEPSRAPVASEFVESSVAACHWCDMVGPVTPHGWDNICERCLARGKKTVSPCCRPDACGGSSGASTRARRPRTWRWSRPTG